MGRQKDNNKNLQSRGPGTRGSEVMPQSEGVLKNFDARSFMLLPDSSLYTIRFCQAEPQLLDQAGLSSISLTVDQPAICHPAIRYLPPGHPKSIIFWLSSCWTVAFKAEGI